MPTLLDLLSSRGMLHDATADLGPRLAAGPITGYVGFDPTADSLHVGSLMPVMALAWLQRLGGRPLVLIGGGTGMIGDPSGKKDERQMLSAETIAANSAAIRAQLSRFLDFGSGPTGAQMFDNAKWLGSIPLLEFLRDVGKHFTVNYMLQKESVKSRMETGISFTEFSYMLIQAYDFTELAKIAGCELQLGGSDQWGNITAGVELGRRNNMKLHGAVLPLLTTAAGAKFGKTEAGNIWLDPAKTSPYAFHQFWLQVDDADVEQLLRFLTFIELDEIAELMRQHAGDRAERLPQRRLADEVATRVHGADAVRRATAAARILFGAGDVRDADPATLAVVAGEVPATTIRRSELDAGIPITDALQRSGLATSRAEARRGLASSGFSVNGVVANASRVITTADLLSGEIVLLRKGKKSWAALTPFP